MTTTPQEPAEDPEGVPDPEREVPDPSQPGEDPGPYPDEGPGGESPEVIPT